MKHDQKITLLRCIAKMQPLEEILKGLEDALATFKVDTTVEKSKQKLVVELMQTLFKFQDEDKAMEDIMKESSEIARAAAFMDATSNQDN